MVDEPEFAEHVNLADILKQNNTLESLVALRDFIANELEGNRCAKCHSSQMRSGDIASLILRLQKILEEIAALEKALSSKDRQGGKDDLADIRARRTGPRTANTENSRNAGLGTKSGPRQQNGRKPRVGSG